MFSSIAKITCLSFCHTAKDLGRRWMGRLAGFDYYSALGTKTSLAGAMHKYAPNLPMALSIKLVSFPRTIHEHFNFFTLFSSYMAVL